MIARDDWTFNMTKLIAANDQTAKSGLFRWHDTGDIQNYQHLEKIAEVAQRLPDTKFWLPTKEFKHVRKYMKKHGDFPPNLNVRLSAHMQNKRLVFRKDVLNKL